MKQLALTRPTKHVRYARMTDRQRSLLAAARAARDLRHPVDVATARACGYRDAVGALRRLERRGLLVRVARGVWRFRVVGESRRG